MISQPSQVGSQPTRESHAVAERVQQLIRQRLLGRQIDGVGFMDELLAIVQQVGEVRCSRAGDKGLRFEVPGHEPFEAPLDANQSKLRMLCARLSVLAQEDGHPPMLYGGEGTIRRAAMVDSVSGAPASAGASGTWTARWSNTPDKHEFVIRVER